MAEKKYIECEAAIAVIEEKQKELCPLGMYSRHAVYGSDREKFDAWQEIIDTLEAIPAADVRPVVRGRWVAEKEDVEWGCSTVRYRCSHCGRLPHFDKESFKFLLSEFCPKCGADMRAQPPKEET